MADMSRRILASEVHLRGPLEPTGISREFHKIHHVYDKNETVRGGQ